MTYFRRAPILILLVLLLLAASAITAEFLCQQRRPYPVFIAERSLTERQLGTQYSSPDENVTVSVDKLESTKTGSDRDYDAVRRLSGSKYVRVLIWRHRCLLRTDLIVAYVEPATGRVLYMTAKYRL